MQWLIRSILGLALVYLLAGNGWAAWSWAEEPRFPVGQSEFISAADCARFASEPGPQHSCAFFFSPMNHARYSDRVTNNAPLTHAMVQLPLVLISAQPGVIADTAVLITGGGGPGNSLGMGRPGYRFEDLVAGSDLFLKAGMDVVLVDQRGTGLSLPRMSCPGLGQTYQSLLADTLDTKKLNDAVEQSLLHCRQGALAQNVDLSAFDSGDSARDFLGLMRELPYQHWVVAGVSYGALLAYEMAAQEPEMVDALILDSLPGLEQEGRYLSSHDLRQRVQSTLQVCQEQRACNKRYPELINQLDRLLDRYQHQAIRLETADGAGFLVDDERLLRILFNAAYWPQYIAYLPYVINAAESDKDTEPLTWLAADYYTWMTDTQYGDLLHTNIFCEVTLPLQQEHLHRFPQSQQDWNKADTQAWQSSLKLCTAWDAQVDYERHIFPAVVNVPSLILSGGLDPVTPSEDALTMQRWLTNSRVVVDSEAAHALLFSAGCAQQHVWRFLLDLKMTGQSQKKCYSQPLHFH